MSTVRKSYLKVPYDLRPAKQIERRIIVDALQRMSLYFPIRDYQYTGFGSIYFVDFIMFHKLLGIDRMLSVEHSDDVKRIKFNQPFKKVKIEFGPIGNYIHDLHPDRKHILWLDYDDHLDYSILDDVKLSTAQLSVGSLLLITTDIHITKELETPSKRYEYYKQEAGYFFDSEWTETFFTKTNQSSINVNILHNSIKNGLVGRSDTEFLPLFKFLYADGHEMLTIGGVIGADTERRYLDACNFDNAFYIRRDITAEPYKITVPMLTKKEKIYLDAEMPCDESWKPDFELGDDEIKAYREIYRFYPSYVEMLL